MRASALCPFLLEDQLTDAERMIRDLARDYAQKQLQPRGISEEYHVMRHMVNLDAFFAGNSLAHPVG